MHRFLTRKNILFPTLWGWTILLVIGILPAVLWIFYGEEYFLQTERLPADALVVEGWIGIEGIRAAKQEFEQGGYKYLITVGGQFHHRWRPQQWNYAVEAHDILIRAGVRPDQVIEAPAVDSDTQRTYTSALAMRTLLEQRNIRVSSLNVFTMGVHARRSRLIFSKVMQSQTEVGVIAWTPGSYNFNAPWWKSSERAQDLLKETIGYSYELLLNSGRLGSSLSR